MRIADRSKTGAASAPGSAAVSAGCREAAEVAAAVLAGGGNAVDAAIAASAVQCVRELPWCGLGGDGFALISSADSERRPEALIGAGAAPLGWVTASIPSAELPGGRLPRFGPLSISVPGLVDAWHRLWERYGTKPWAELIDPAAALAEEGFALDAAFAQALARARDHADTDDAFSAEICADNGAAAGERFKLPALARTLRRIAASGRQTFYEGGLAGEVVSAVSALGGLLSASDLREHAADFEPPLMARFGDADVLVTPPVSMGWTLLQQLLLYERLKVCGIGGEADRIDAMVRCKHAAFAELAAMSRWRTLSDVMPTLQPEALDGWCSQIIGQRAAPPPDAAAAARAAAVTAASSGRAAGDGGHARHAAHAAAVTAAGSGSHAAVGGGDTTCLSVVDGSGLMVTLIQSLFNEFGARAVVPGTGIVLNDRLARQPVGIARVAGPPSARRPLHTLIAYCVKHEDWQITGATPGGRGQPQTNFQVLRAIIDDADSPQAAVDRPRWRSGAARMPGADNMLFLEPGFGESVRAELRRRGHEVVTDQRRAKSDMFGSCTIAGLRMGARKAFGAADHRRSAALAFV